MKNITIKRRIQLSFLAILALMVLMAVFVLSRLATVETDAHKQKYDSLPGQMYSAEIRGLLRRDYSLALHHLLADDLLIKQNVRRQIEANLEELQETIDEYVLLPQESEVDNLLAELAPIREDYGRAHDQMLAASAAGEEQLALQIMRESFIPAFEHLLTATQTLMDENRAEAEASATHILDSVGSAQRDILLVSIVAVLLALFLGYFLMRAISVPLTRLVGALNELRLGDFTGRINLQRNDEFGEVADGFNRMVDELTALVGQIQKTGLQITTSVTEVAATARQQQATAGEIAASTSEIGTTSKEISATSKELVRTMDDVGHVVDQSATLASNSQTGLRHMEETMEHVMSAASSINARLGILNEKAGSITQMITTITKVADQTNLLSLNAAIEAEKAGEYGKGFSVVATQIRRLADQTAVATYDIELMVKEIQSAVSASVMGMDKFADEVRRGMQEVQNVSGQLGQIIAQVQTLAPRFESVNEGVQAQSVGAEQISEALLQLSEAAEQTVESIRQSNLAIDDLSQTAQTLRGGISRFKLRD